MMKMEMPLVKIKNNETAEYIGTITSDLILDMYEKVRDLPDEEKPAALDAIKELSRNIGKELVKPL